MSAVYGTFVGSEWRLAIQYVENGTPGPTVCVTSGNPYRTEKVARKAAERLNTRYGTTYSRYVAVQVDLRIHEVPA